MSAFVAENQLTLGKVTADEKSNEITAVPELLDLIDIKGSIITADAMSCQKEIVRKIRDKKAEYVIALKQNQPALRSDADLYFQTSTDKLPSVSTTEKAHGRIESRTYQLLTDVTWLSDKGQWTDLKAIGMVKSKRIIQGEESYECRYYITSLTAVEQFAYAVRKHWSIENQLHWCLDVIFRKDAARARKDLSPLNLNVLRKVALALCRNAEFDKRVSLQKRRYWACLDPVAFLRILFG